MPGEIFIGSYTGDLQCMCVIGTFSDHEGNTSKTVMTNKRSLSPLTGHEVGPCYQKFCVRPCTGSTDTCSIFVVFFQ